MAELCTMRIVFSTYESPGLSGNFRRAIQIAKGLNQNACQVILITSSTKFQLFPRKIVGGNTTIIESAGWLPYKYRFSGFDPFDLVFRTLLCLWLNADAYHSFNPKPVSVLSCWVAARVLRKPWFFDWADLWGPGGIFEIKKKYTSWFTRCSSLIETWLEKVATSKADHTTCISQKMVEITSKRGGQPHYLTVGAAPDLFPLNKQVCRTKLGFAAKDKIVGFVYTDSPDAELLKSVIKRLEMKNIQFVIMGPPLFANNQPANILYNSITKRHHLSLLLSACDICVVPFSPLPINEYRYPNKIGDYLACHIPFITNPVGDMTNLILKNHIGWLVPAEPSKMVTKIISIFKSKSEMRKKEETIATYAHQKTWKLLTKQLKRLYLTSTISK